MRCFPRIILFTCVVLLYSCAAYHVRQGNRLYDDLAYSQAVKEYEKALGKKHFAQAQIRLAESYYRMNELAKASEQYAKVVQMPEAEPAHKLRYGQLLMRSGKHEQAKAYLDQYLEKVPNDEGVKLLRASCDSVEHWKRDSARYTIEPSKINTGQSNFAPVFYKQGVVFTSDRNAKAKTYEWTGRPFLDLYYAKQEGENNYGSPVAMQGDINGMFHDGTATFTTTGDTMFFTRDNYVKRKVEKSDKDVVNLKIYQAVKKDTLWKNITQMTFNSDDYSTGHPTLTKDGNTMYFVSDMPGGMGGTDLYMTKRVDGEWSKPVNLGPSVNTVYNEMFPSLWQDSLLYFSSEGHMNMGGLDIFSSTRTANGWSQAQNMGYPLNSSYDDFGIAMNDSATGGLFSSNRNTGNTAQDQIYSFLMHDLRFTLDGIAVEKQTQEPLAGVSVELVNIRTGLKETIVTGEDGKFSFKLNPESEYTVMGSKDTYFTNTEKVSTVGKVRSENMFVKLKLEMEQIIINKPIVLENIYYDLDKYDIRPDAAAGLDRLVQIMNDNPQIRIELSSHTDSRADDQYNDVLSQRRAESAVAYIIGKGISQGRITAKGYGERQLVNNCANKVPCSEEAHQQNRRTEFKVVSQDEKKL